MTNQKITISDLSLDIELLKEFTRDQDKLNGLFKNIHTSTNKSIELIGKQVKCIYYSCLILGFVNVVTFSSIFFKTLP